MKVIEVFFIFLKLGLTSFGGPVAHISFFREEFVFRRKWIDEQSYADLVSLCQFLPGPASSQMGMAIGFHRARYIGAIAAWFGFTMPSAILLILFALGISNISGNLNLQLLHGLKIAAASVVAHAIWGMNEKLCPDKPRKAMALSAALAAIYFSTALTQIILILMGSIVGLIFFKGDEHLPKAPFSYEVSKKQGLLFLILFFAVLFLSTAISSISSDNFLKQTAQLYKTGSIVFGGGHVVLPLLKTSFVDTNHISSENFLAGYGAAQAIPGPLFSFAAYLGSISSVQPQGFLGGFIAVVAIFLPSFFLIFGCLPYWESFRQSQKLSHATKGINAIVVGLLLSAFINPVWSSAIYNWTDGLLMLTGLAMLVIFELPSWLVVTCIAVSTAFINTL